MTTAHRDADLVPAVLDLVSDVRGERDRLLEDLRQTKDRLASKDALCATLEAALTATNRERANSPASTDNTAAPDGEQMRKDLSLIHI